MIVGGDDLNDINAGAENKRTLDNNVSGVHEMSDSFVLCDIEGPLHKAPMTQNLKAIYPVSDFTIIEEEHLSSHIKREKRYCIGSESPNERRKRCNVNPPGANNRYGRKGTLGCSQCRKRNRKVRIY